MIYRTGACPPFIEYVTKKALIPNSTTPTAAFIQLTQFNFSWIDIPSYQRGLVWDDALLEELLASRSRFLGNAVLGQFPIPAGRPSGFANVPTNVANYELLIDGLQRFSIGTALLSLLHSMVFTIPPLKATAAPHFAALQAHAVQFAPIYQHNDAELKEHPRQAVKESYTMFRHMLANWLSGEIDDNPGQIAAQLTHLFLERQIAPDTYIGFGSGAEIAQTFIGLNTIRMQLNVVDWLRSIIVERGTKAGWSYADVEFVENRFSDVFLSDKGTEPEAGLTPFAAIMKEILDEPDSSGNAVRFFPTWTSGLAPAEVLRFLDFVEEVYASRLNPFFREIRDCGAIPLATCLCHYYREYLKANVKPSFIHGGTNEDQELHTFLRAVYRALFDGRIGRTRVPAERMARAAKSDLLLLANQLSQTFIGVDLTQPVDPDWLRAALRKADAKRAQRIFNACLLPPFSQPGPATFRPQQYGRGGNEYQVDHIIPKSVLIDRDSGGTEGNLLGNFAPIRGSANNSQTHLSASAKLANGGNYANEAATDATVHPYVNWLVTKQGSYGSTLDLQEFLVPNSTPPWAAERFAYLVDQLLPRL